MNKNEFSDVIKVLNLRTDYECITEDHKFQIPKNRKILDLSTAEWAVDKIGVFNKKNKKTTDLIKVCREYLEMIEEINGIKFTIE